MDRTYDSTGRVLQQVQAGGGTFQIAYRVVAGSLTGVTETDPNGNTLTYRVNAGRVLTESTDALGQVSQTVRAAGSNLVTSRTDALGRPTQYTYDSNGNVLTITDPLNNTRTFTYDPTFNQVTSITDPLGNVTSFEYDTQGNLIAITDPLQNTQPPANRLKTTFTYNPAGQPLTTTDPVGNTTTFTYDTTGNLTAVSDPLGHTTQRSYDSVSRLIAQTDPLGKTTRFSYDLLNRLVQLVDAVNGSTAFGYDPNGNLLTVTDARGNTTTHEYDSMDHLNRRIDQLGKAETFSYDGNGNLVSTTDRKNQTSTFTYDPLNRRTQATHADGAVASFTYDAGGRLLQADDTADPHRPIQMVYDPLDRLLTETTALGTVSYQYDAVGRRTQMTVSGQSPIAYTYDLNARLRTITQAPLNPVDIQYDALGRRTLLTLPNGVSTEYQYDVTSRLTALIYRNAVGTLGDLQYTYDVGGNRIGVGGSFARSLLPDTVPTASYDSANRQLSFSDTTMSFDDNGNLTSLTTSGQTTTYTWDTRNRLTAIGGTSLAASFPYDALSRRALKTINGQTTTFQYDGLEIAQETGVNGVATYLRTLAIDETLMRTDGSGTVHYLTDALGSTVALADAPGATRTSYTYAPFGDTAVSGSPSANAFQFTGRENDGTGVYYYRARYYHPSLARFLGEDPLGITGGDINLYSYTGNSPVNMWDPSGEVIPLIIVGAVAAGAWSATIAEAGEWYFGGSVEEVKEAGIRSGVGGAVGAAVTLAVPVSAPAAATIGGAAAGFVESLVGQVQTGSRSITDLAVGALTGAALGRLGEAISPTGTTRVVSQYLMRQVKDLHSLQVSSVPAKVMRQISTLDDRLRSIVQGAVNAQITREILKPTAALGGRK